MRVSGAAIRDALEETRSILCSNLDERRRYSRALMFQKDAELVPNAVYLCTSASEAELVSEGRSLPILCSPTPICPLAPSKGVRLPHITVQVGPERIPSLVNAVSSVFGDLAELSDSLTDLVERHAPLSQLLEAAVPVLRNPLFFCTQEIDDSVIAVPKELKDRVPMDAERHGALRIDPPLANPDELEAMASSQEPFVNEQTWYATGEKIQILWLAVRGDDSSALGYLGLCMLEGKPTQLLSEELRIVGNAVGRHLRQAEEIDMGQQSIHDIVLSMLQGDMPDADSLEDKLRRLGIVPGSPYFCATIATSDGVIPDISIPYFQSHIERRIERCIAVKGKHGVLLVVHRNLDSAEAELLKKQIELATGSANIRIGLSDESSDILALRLYALQSYIAVAHASSSGIVRFGDTAVDYILEKGSTELPSALLCHPGLMKLASGPESEGIDPLGTLRAYFDCMGNVSQAADKLHLHRTTMLYRLKRIEKLSGVDLDDPDQRLYCELSLRLIEKTAASRARLGGQKPARKQNSTK